MKVIRSCGWAWQQVLMVAFSVMFSQAWADGTKTKTVPSKPAVEPAADESGKPKAASALSRTTIEQVQVSRIRQHVQVQVQGRGELSCVPFQLSNPDRLVLDCSGALLHMKQRAIPSDLQPVRAVRVGQFKDDMARLVIDLERQGPYTIRSNGNVVTVVFGLAAGADADAAAHEEKETSVASDAESGELVPQLWPNLTDLRRISLSLSPAQPAVVPTNPVRARVDPSARFKPETDSTDAEASQVVPAAPESQAARTFTEESVSEPPEENYVIGPQDVIAVNVWREPELSRVVPVRPDGKISLPLVGEMTASGLTPPMLETRISKRLEAYVHKPEVTVIVQEANSHKFYIIGQVERPGAYVLASDMTVLDALAAAGGFRDFAKVKKIYLLRRRSDGTRISIPFNFKEAVNGRGHYREVKLLPGDTIVIP